MIQQIPTLFDGTVAYRQRTRLGIGDAAADWILDFRFNARTGMWHFSMLDLESTPVLTGQAVTCGIDLNLLQRAVGGPGGYIFALSGDGGVEAPGLLELGDRVVLFYSDNLEL